MDFFLEFGLILCIIIVIILYRKLDETQKSYIDLTRKHQKLSDSNHSLNAALEAVTQQGISDKSSLESSLNAVCADLDVAKENYKTLLSQKKSSEVRLGNIAEKLVPFLDYFTYEPANAVFLGQPIDYVVFEEDGITFVEIKSGKSQLSAKQRNIRDLVKSKQVSWKEIRIN